MNPSNSIIYEHKGRIYFPNRMVFSGGEVNVRLPLENPKTSTSFDETITLSAYIKSTNDVMELLLVTDAVRRRHPKSPIKLFMPYLPYARQDRVCNEGEALSVKVFADLINSQGYELVTILDCHSDVGAALINRCVNVPLHEIVLKTRAELPSRLDNWKLISPDAGANKKVLSFANALGGLEVIRADKTRNTRTGEITGTEVYAGDLTGFDCLILDDICDGGRTFYELAKVLKAKNARRVDLWVTHGIFSNGLASLAKYIDHIYTTDSFSQSKSTDFITVIKTRKLS
jgi:ribose-phosphate pyrophosphokinase